jgi:FkbM family methyltransferase
MNWAGTITRSALRGLESVIGRRNLVRLGRLISMQARLDSANDMANNGELMVQDVVLASDSGVPMIVFDVGANIGEWSRHFLQKSGTRPLEMHLFEPASATYARLQDCLRNESSRVVFVNQALSDTCRTTEFAIVGAGLGVNSLHASLSKAESVEVIALNTVDNYCKLNSIGHIDLIKIDAEGHDMHVLRGAQEMLGKRAISALQFEYNQRWIDARHFLKDAFDLLLPLGYQMGKVTSRGIEFYPSWHFELESFREGNYLACLPECVERFPKVDWWHN